MWPSRLNKIFLILLSMPTQNQMIWFIIYHRDELEHIPVKLCIGVEVSKMIWMSGIDFMSYMSLKSMIKMRDTII